MLSPKGKGFWIVFPLMVTAVSVFAVSRLRRGAAPATYVSEDIVRPAQADSATPAPPQPPPVTIPADTEIEVRLNRALATNRIVSGDRFSATVADSVVVDGQEVIPAGSPVTGKVVTVREAGRLKGVAELRLALESVDVEGSVYDLHSSVFTRLGHNHKRRNWAFIGGGGGGGALIGALAGGAKGLLIGAPIGAAAGTAGAAETAKRNLVIPAETALTFRLISPVEVHL